MRFGLFEWVFGDLQMPIQAKFADFQLQDWEDSLKNDDTMYFGIFVLCLLLALGLFWGLGGYRCTTWAALVKRERWSWLSAVGVGLVLNGIAAVCLTQYFAQEWLAPHEIPTDLSYYVGKSFWLFVPVALTLVLVFWLLSWALSGWIVGQPFGVPLKNRTLGLKKAS